MEGDCCRARSIQFGFQPLHGRCLAHAGVGRNDQSRQVHSRLAINRQLVCGQFITIHFNPVTEILLGHGRSRSAPDAKIGRMQVLLRPVRFQQQPQTLRVDERRFVAGAVARPLFLPSLLDRELVGRDKLFRLASLVDILAGIVLLR